MAQLKTTPIVALDFPSTAAALSMVDRLGDRCRFYKIGNELFTAEGPEVVRQVLARGADVFLDLKFHDIPNTVAGGVRSALAMGVRLVTVHAAGGAAMVSAAVKAAGGPGSPCGILAVTALTSLSASDLATAWGRSDAVQAEAEVVRLAGLAESAGAHGVVCSGLEAQAVRNAHRSLAILVPGVRPAGVSVNDQSRVVTPGQAVAAGATYVVIGRAVTADSDPAAAMERIASEIAAAQRGSARTT